MDKIFQYYKITNVKPDYHILESPYYNSSNKRIIFNGKDLELHYSDEFHTYIEEPLKYTVGGSEKKVIILSI